MVNRLHAVTWRDKLAALRGKLIRFRVFPLSLQIHGGRGSVYATRRWRREISRFNAVILVIEAGVPGNVHRGSPYRSCFHEAGLKAKLILSKGAVLTRMAVPVDKFQRVEIVSRKDHSADLWSIRVRTEQKLSFKPGQYATLGVERDAKIIQKAYSIVSSPLEEEMEFFFELVPNGELTPLLYNLGVGDSMWMRRQARGLFILDQVSGHAKHYLLCTVTGVAPYVSMVRTFSRGEPAASNCEIVLIQAASRSWEFAYREELEAWSREFGWLRYIPIVSRPWEDTDWKGEVGRVEDVARKYSDALALDPSVTTAYLCGHPQMIENCKGILQRRGFPKESVREEIYWIPAKPSKAQVTA